MNRFMLVCMIAAYVIRVQSGFAIDSVSNSVDWASAPSVIKHIETLVLQYGKGGAVPQFELTNAVVSADCLWTNCLDFTIVTNNYALNERLITTKYETLLVISMMNSFSYNAQNRRSAILMMKQIEPYLKIDLGKSVPLPHTLVCLETIHSNDTAEVIQYKTQWNENAISNRTARMLEFKQDQAKRLFFRALKYLNFYLDVYISGFPQ